MLKSRIPTLFVTSLALGLFMGCPEAVFGSTKEFKKLFASKNSWEKANAIKTLDPNDPKAYKILSKILQTGDWYLRHACIEVLSAAFEGEIVEKLQKDLKKGKPTLAEGIALAIGKSGDPSRIADLTGALQHKDWRVRRSAAIAIKNIPDKRAIEPLLEAWKTELKKGKQFRVWVRCIEALEEITGQRELQTLGDWEAWWSGAKDQFAVGANKKKKKDKSRTVERGVSLEYDTRGKGGTLLVIPDYGFESDYLKTYLRNLESTNRIIYMSLPGAVDFDPPLPPAQGQPYPVYPLEKLVTAFEDLIKTLVKEKQIKKGPINVLAHGMSSWIGMTYAAKYPKSVKRLILVAPFSSGKAWSDGNNRHVKHGQRVGDLEEEHFAKSRILEQGGKSQYVPSGADDQDALRRKKFTIYFQDIQDSEISEILGPKVTKQVGKQGQSNDFKVFRPMGTVIIPSDFKLFALSKSPVRTLVIAGAGRKCPQKKLCTELMTSLDDCKAIVKHYPNGQLAVFGKSARMPFMEENSKFVKLVSKFTR